ncbi:SPFH domain-containing protein, partial [candidate division CSSED10-310 bacterium]
TETGVYTGPYHKKSQIDFARWQDELKGLQAFSPVVIGRGNSPSPQSDIKSNAPALELTRYDEIGVVTVHDGPPIESGEIIAPEVKSNGTQYDHNYFQDPEAFLALDGRRGKQLQVLTDGTFFINRWFATVEKKPKKLIPIGYVGVVVSYHGASGKDLTETSFRYGEQVDPGHRGVWKRALPPGKYPLNPYALKVELVPTVNFVLRWVTGVTEQHQYDEDLKSIELITLDGYEPILPMSLILHIDYEKAPRVVQRFGDVKRLITQTLDPLISAYFRDVAQTIQMLDLLTHRDQIQRHATEELSKRFQNYDISCIAVLIGRPETRGAQTKDIDPIERLFDQLRQRRLAQEQVLTFKQQKEAALKLKELNDAQAAAEKQNELTQTKIDIQIAGNRGEAQLAEAERLAKREVTLAQGQSRSKELLGKGEASRVGQVGLAEAAVLLKKIQAFGDSRLYTLRQVSELLSQSAQPLVPERLLVMGNGNGKENGETDPGSLSVIGQLLTLLLSEHAGIDFNKQTEEIQDLEKYADILTDKSA